MNVAQPDRQSELSLIMMLEGENIQPSPLGRSIEAELIKAKSMFVGAGNGDCIHGRQLSQQSIPVLPMTLRYLISFDKLVIHLFTSIFHRYLVYDGCVPFVKCVPFVGCVTLRNTLLRCNEATGRSRRACLLRFLLHPKDHEKNIDIKKGVRYYAGGEYVDSPHLPEEKEREDEDCLRSRPNCLPRLAILHEGPYGNGRVRP